MPHKGFELTSSWSGVRRSNQIASWPVELVFISGGFYSSLQYHVRVLNAKSFVAPSSTMFGYWMRRALSLSCGVGQSESAWQVSLPMTCQAASVTQPDRLCVTCQSGHASRRGHHYRRLKPHGSSMLLELRVHATQGIWTHVLLIWS